MSLELSSIWELWRGGGAGEQGMLPLRGQEVYAEPGNMGKSTVWASELCCEIKMVQADT